MLSNEILIILDESSFNLDLQPTHAWVKKGTMPKL